LRGGVDLNETRGLLILELTYVIALEVKVNRGIVSCPPMDVDPDGQCQPPNREIYMTNPHLLPNNPAKQYYCYNCVTTESALRFLL
jgi:hypothetical protein